MECSSYQNLTNTLIAKNSLWKFYFTNLAIKQYSLRDWVHIAIDVLSVNDSHLDDIPL